MEAIIRRMQPDDREKFYSAFVNQGWHVQIETFENYYLEQENGSRRVFVAEWEGRPVGYVTLLPRAIGGPFEAVSYPELEDFNVLEQYQKRGIGSRILEEAETCAKKGSDFISLAVGLHKGYGAAQRLYIKRGYLPDGTGAWYRKKPLTPYTMCCNDDDLVLYMSKKIK